jgi:hypothetical protein
MFEFIFNQARRAQQQRHLKRGARARQRAIDSSTTANDPETEVEASSAAEEADPSEPSSSDIPQSGVLENPADSFQQNYHSN